MSAISYEVAIILCQRNERAGTSRRGSVILLTVSACLDRSLHRRMKAEKVAAAGHIINRQRDHLLE